MPRRRAVALLIETSNSYARGLLAGITDYVRQHAHWSIYLPEQGRGDAPPAWLNRWQGDGIIARIENPEIAQAVVRTKLPAVDVSAARLVPMLPWVETDDREIARLAAEHLLERGFRQLAFCGEPAFQWSQARCQHFTAHIEQAGLSCQVFAARGPGSSWQITHKRLQAWVRELPKPIGVFACYDRLAQQLLDACRDSEVMVPEEVAVLGVDNDELLCELCTPPLTSVMPDTRQTGQRAAAMLDRMMDGEEITSQGQLIRPLGIQMRQSTDVLAIEDREIAQALKLIREHACLGINVNDVLKEIPLSRRVLEARFRKVLGRTPHDEILRVKLDRVQQLLRETDWTLAEIARRAGFPHVEYLSVAFKRAIGVPPSIYRQQQQHLVRIEQG